MHLVEGYELVAGTRIENVYLYYELVKVAAVGDAQYMKLIFNMPLKTASRYFVLQKIIALPTPISNDTFVQHLLEFSYFGIDNTVRSAMYNVKHGNCVATGMDLQ